MEFKTLITYLPIILQFINPLRDRAKLKCKCEYKIYEPSEERQFAIITIKVINVGRRPIVLSKIGSTCNDGTLISLELNRNSGGHKLSENEFFEKRIDEEHDLLCNPQNSPAKDFWVEDSRDKKYRIKNSKNNLLKLCKRVGKYF